MNYEEIGYELFAIKFTDKIQEFIKISDNKNSYWLSISEINKLGFKASYWFEYLINSNNNILGFYAKEQGLNLLKQPSVNSEVISLISGDLDEIKLTNERSGQWCKVIVNKYKEHPCETELNEKQNKLYKMEGWLKIIDDNGEPNIWNYVRGC